MNIVEQRKRDDEVRMRLRVKHYTHCHSCRARREGASGHLPPHLESLVERLMDFRLPDEEPSNGRAH
jgi:hypothetical protein